MKGDRELRKIAVSALKRAKELHTLGQDSGQLTKRVKELAKQENSFVSETFAPCEKCSKHTWFAIKRLDRIAHWDGCKC